MGWSVFSELAVLFGVTVAFLSTLILFSMARLSFPDLSLLKINRDTIEPVTRNIMAAVRPYHLRRECKAEWTPFQTFSEGYIRYWLALSLTSFSKSPLLNRLSIKPAVILDGLISQLPARAIHSVWGLGFCKIFFLIKISSSIALALVYWLRLVLSSMSSIRAISRWL